MKSVLTGIWTPLFFKTSFAFYSRLVQDLNMSSDYSSFLFLFFVQDCVPAFWLELTNLGWASLIFAYKITILMQVVICLSMIFHCPWVVLNYYLSWIFNQGDHIFKKWKFKNTSPPIQIFDAIVVSCITVLLLLPMPAPASTTNTTGLPPPPLLPLPLSSQLSPLKEFE